MQRFLIGLGLLSAALTTSGAAIAAANSPLASGQKIQDVLSGNTLDVGVASRFTDTSYFDTDGTVDSDGYSGYWYVVGDKLCIDYDNDPEKCWSAKVNVDEVTLFYKGRLDAFARIVPGNPNGF